MSAPRVFSSLVVLVALASPGCALETPDEEFLGDEIEMSLDPMGGPSDPQDLPPGSGNGFGPACMKSALKAIQKYGSYRLWNNPGVDADGYAYGTLPPNPYMAALSQTCRDQVLKYAMRCALPKDTYAIYPGDGSKHWGWLNITTQWRSLPLTGAGAPNPDDPWWFTACMYQHLNGFGVEVRILLDGAKTGLFPTNASHSVFTKRDSRIWGNLFTATGDFVPNVCYETDLLTSCEEFAVVDTRLCDSDPTLNCNVNIVGPCSTVCTYSSQGAYCGTGGFKNIGSRLKDFTSYGTMCL